MAANDTPWSGKPSSEKSRAGLTPSHPTFDFTGDVRTEPTGNRGPSLRTPERTPAPATAFGDRSSGTRRAVIVAAVAMLALAMTSLTAWTLLRDTDSLVGNDTANPGVTSPTPGTTADPTQAGDPTSGPGFTTNSRISADGAVESSATMVFEQPVSSMTITVPGANTAWLAGDFHPKVAHLLLTAGGAPLPGVADRLAAGGSAVVELPPGTTAVDMTYRATGVTIRTTPSIPTRALVLVNPLGVSARSSLSATVHVVGTRILNLGCSGPEIAAAACGAPAADGWQVKNSEGAGKVAVVAQVDLSEQRSTP